MDHGRKKEKVGQKGIGSIRKWSQILKRAKNVTLKAKFQRFIFLW